MHISFNESLSTKDLGHLEKNFTANNFSRDHPAIHHFVILVIHFPFHNNLDLKGKKVCKFKS